MASSKDLDSFYSTVVAFGLLTAAIYIFLLRPLLSGAPARRGPNVAPTATRGRGGGRRASGAGDEGMTDPSSVRHKQPFCTRFPPHVASGSAKIAHSGGANLLVDGMLAFRHGKGGPAQPGHADH